MSPISYPSASSLPLLQLLGPLCCPLPVIRVGTPSRQPSGTEWIQCCAWPASQAYLSTFVSIPREGLTSPLRWCGDELQKALWGCRRAEPMLFGFPLGAGCTFLPVKLLGLKRKLCHKTKQNLILHRKPLGLRARLPWTLRLESHQGEAQFLRNKVSSSRPTAG